MIDLGSRVSLVLLEHHRIKKDPSLVSIVHRDRILIVLDYHHVEYVMQENIQYRILIRNIVAVKIVLRVDMHQEMRAENV